MNHIENSGAATGVARRLAPAPISRVAPRVPLRLVKCNHLGAEPVPGQCVTCGAAKRYPCTQGHGGGTGVRWSVECQTCADYAEQRGGVAPSGPRAVADPAPPAPSGGDSGAQVGGAPPPSPAGRMTPPVTGAVPGPSAFLVSSGSGGGGTVSVSWIELVVADPVPFGPGPCPVGSIAVLFPPPPPVGPPVVCLTGKCKPGAGAAGAGAPVTPLVFTWSPPCGT